MIDPQKVARFITVQRKQKGFTQQQLADRLHLSFQAVSKWETGLSLPGADILMDLSKLLGVSVDELLTGALKADSITYSKSGVDIAYTDSIKREMASFVHRDTRVLNGLGAFASLYDMHFKHIRHPVLVLKAEEPGSNTKLRLKHRQKINGNFKRNLY